MVGSAEPEALEGLPKQDLKFPVAEAGLEVLGRRIGLKIGRSLIGEIGEELEKGTSRTIQTSV